MGSAMGTNDSAAKKNNSPITPAGNPFPTNSSTYFQRNCMNKINTEMTNVIAKDGRYDLKINRVSVFTRCKDTKQNEICSKTNKPPNFVEGLLC